MDIIIHLPVSLHNASTNLYTLFGSRVANGCLLTRILAGWLLSLLMHIRAVPNIQIFEDKMQLPPKKNFFLLNLYFLTVISPSHHPHHVAQLPVDRLRMSNIRSESKSEYPVIKLFKNAQP